MRRLLLLILILMCVPLSAQDDDTTPTPDPADTVTTEAIGLGSTVTDTITEAAIFDRFTFDARRGDVLRAVMNAEGGLIPRLGFSNAGGNIIVRTDQDASGEPLEPPAPNSTIQLEYEIPADGSYAVVATRFGGAEGTTTGRYVLTLDLVSTSAFMDGPPQETFSCGEITATTIMSLSFGAEPGSDSYRVSVYGLDGFDPILNVMWGDDVEVTDCSSDSQQMGGDEVVLLDGQRVEFAGDSPENAAQFTFTGGTSLGTMFVNVGSIDGAEGRYVIVVEGFELAQPGEHDTVNLSLGPAVMNNGQAVYMVKDGVTRIDPLLEILNEATGEADLCDDAGRAGCEDVRAVVGAGVNFNDGKSLLGDRFAAGMAVVPNDNTIRKLDLSSRVESATGPYALMFFGELPGDEVGPTRPGG